MEEEGRKTYLGDEEPREEVGGEVEEAHHVHVLAFEHPAPDVDEVAREVVPQVVGLEAEELAAAQQAGDAEDDLGRGGWVGGLVEEEKAV